MSETTKRTRKANPFTAYAKAKQKADVARRAAARTADLAEKATAALARAEQEAARRDAAEVEEQAALDALQAALGELNTDTDQVADVDA